MLVVAKSRLQEIVVLLSLNWYRRKDPRTPLGVAYLYSELVNSSVLNSNTDVRIINCDVRDNLSTLIHELMVLNPIILGIGVYAWNAVYTRQVVSALRSLGYQGTIVLGGPEITYGGNELNDEFSEVQYFVKGFGEVAFTNIVRSILNNEEPVGPGIYRRGDKIAYTLAVPSLGISSSPFSHSRLLTTITGTNFIRWQTQRGCIYRCSFCAFKLPNGSIVESDLETVEYELKKIAATGAGNVAVLDPVFFVDRQRSTAILELIERITPRVKFSIQTRFEHLDDRLIEKISQLNIKLECGLQTLDPRVQREIKRLNNRESVMSTMERLANKQVQFETHLIYGLPFQSLDSFLLDVKTLIAHHNRRMRIFPLSLLRGTEIDMRYGNPNSGVTFAPTFPREVIETKWMDMYEVMKLKNMQKELEDRNGRLTYRIFKGLTFKSGDLV